MLNVYGVEETEFELGIRAMFTKNAPVRRDFDAATVSPYKIWKKFGYRYKCSNCGYIPTYVNIADLKKCPKCEIIKTFYETSDGLMPTFREDDEMYEEAINGGLENS